MEATKLFKVTVSFGNVNSLISLPCYMSHASIPADVRAARGLPDDLVRISTGIEHVDDLIGDLEQAMSLAMEKVGFQPQAAAAAADAAPPTSLSTSSSRSGNGNGAVTYSFNGQAAAEPSQAERALLERVAALEQQIASFQAAAPPSSASHNGTGAPIGRAR